MMNDTEHAKAATIAIASLEDSNLEVNEKIAVLKTAAALLENNMLAQAHAQALYNALK